MQEMQAQDLEGFTMHEPVASKKTHTILVSLGLHHEWSANGHNKLLRIWFLIWAVHDKWCGKWLGLWVVPNVELAPTVHSGR